MTEQKRFSWQGWLILAIPVVVMAAVYLLLPGNQDERNNLLSFLGTTNNGELIEPLRTLEALELTTVEGERWQAAGNGKWKLVIADDGRCNQACQQSLFITRQIHKLLPKRTNHLERIYLSSGELSAEQAQRLADEYPGVSVLRDNRSGFDALIAETNVPANPAELFYLLDPRGNLVLYYTTEHNYKTIIKDLKVLL